MGCGNHKLDDSDRLIRHCPKKFYDQGKVSAKSFWFTKRELKEDRPFLSFSWLEHICRLANVPVDIEAAIDRLEEYFPRDIKKDVEAWIILSCDRVKTAISKVPGTDPKVCLMPDDYNSSHVGVLGFEKHLHEDVASELGDEVRLEDVHPVTRTRDNPRR
ncbi:MAG: hypothetical protein OXG60_06465 [Chloroflexi bacterium]|nr:hypothetical protein [Chloroflexota bacterium]